MTGWIAAGAVLLAALALVLLERGRTIRTLSRLDAMLTAAMDGTFSEQSFDESRLSALESRMVQYLAANSASARNLRRQKDQISALISDISHQTRTPVANLQLYASLLAEQPLSEQGQDCVKAIAGQAEKLQTLIEALVKTSRLETGILALHPAADDVVPVVERAVGQYALLAEQKGVRLTWKTEEAAPIQAIFDAKWTEEALCNLLDNAVKYTPEGGTVTVGAVRYEMFCALRVTDTGPGIPETEQAQIFGRFWRAPGAYEEQGVGIGLYLTRQIMRNQGGYVRVKSAPGEGSTFSLFLPRG